VEATQLPRVEHLFGLLDREAFVANNARHVNIPRQRESVATFLDLKEEAGRQFPHVTLAISLFRLHVTCCADCLGS
jgi:hypothetical protein